MDLFPNYDHHFADGEPLCSDVFDHPLASMDLFINYDHCFADHKPFRLDSAHQPVVSLNLLINNDLYLQMRILHARIIKKKYKITLNGEGVKERSAPGRG